MNKPYIVGITGGSASGKTYFLQQLLKSFDENEICLISQDNYYKPIEEQPQDHQGIVNFDIPQSIDFERYAKDIEAIKSGKSISLKEYTFNNKDVIPKTLTFHPSPIIVIEGIFVFYYMQIARQIDLKLFIDAKEHIKLKRRILRDQVERGYDLHDVLYRYENHVAPTYDKYIEPFKHDADFIIPNNAEGFDNPLHVIVTFLESQIAQAQKSTQSNHS